MAQISDGFGNPVGGGTIRQDVQRANGTAPAGDRAETEIDLTDLLGQLTAACMESAQRLDAQMQGDGWKDSPVVYTIPTMKVTMKVALTSSRERVKGVLWWRTQQGETTQSLSQIELELVAVPRSA
jgi:hypothetical protein